mgnify:CR=1 FL=1
MKRSRGFSLLEILVAFTILALSLGVAMQIFSGAMRNADIVRDQAEATALAQTLLAGAGTETPLGPSESSGALADRFRWQLSVVPFDEGHRPGTSGNVSAATQITLWRVTASVSWDSGDGDRERNVALSTLRVGKSEGP